MNFKLLVIGTLAAALSGCAATQLNPGASRVRVLNQDPTDCEFLGEVVGSQGNFFTGGYTSNKNLELGARNDMKNQAYAMGANAIVLTTSRSANTGSWGRYGGGTSQTSSTSIGSAYKCDNSTASHQNKKRRQAAKRSSSRNS